MVFLQIKNKAIGWFFHVSKVHNANNLFLQKLQENFINYILVHSIQKHSQISLCWQAKFVFIVANPDPK